MTDLHEGTVQSLAGRFADVLRDWLTDEEWQTVRQRNAAPEYDGDMCASHDFVDANMAMDAAFRHQFGRAPDTENGTDLAYWNAAWKVAKSGWLTEGADK